MSFTFQQAAELVEALGCRVDEALRTNQVTSIPPLLDQRAQLLEEICLQPRTPQIESWLARVESADRLRLAAARRKLDDLKGEMDGIQTRRVSLHRIAGAYSGRTSSSACLKSRG